MALTAKRATVLTRSGIMLLHRARVPDASMLVARAAGHQNLQAHAQHLTGLAASFLAADPASRKAVANGTTLSQSLSGKERVWPTVQNRFARFIQNQGSRVVSKELKSGRSLSAKGVVDTYLPVSWGGTQTKGGGGISTLKRAIKIGSHVLASFK